MRTIRRKFLQIVTLFRGLFIVLKYALKKPVTLRYPEEKRTLPIRSRGRHYLTKWEDGKERCVGCELCAIVCPSQAIYVKPAANTSEDPHSHGERYASDFQINMLRCIFCGFCEDACPKEAIFLETTFAPASFDRNDFIYGKDRLVDGFKRKEIVSPITTLKEAQQVKR